MSRAPATRSDLTALTELAATFARAYPTLATRLAAPSTDPDVERLLEAFADLTERVHRNLDADAPRAAHFFAELILPELSRPFPCATMLAVEPTTAQRITLGADCEFESNPVDGTRCRFRVGCAVDIVPWLVTHARIVWSADAGQELVISLRSVDSAPLPLSTLFPLRLHLAGDPRVARALLLYLRCHVREIELRDAQQPSFCLSLGARVDACGLASTEALLPIEENEHPGYRLVREYYTFSAKLSFVELPMPAHIETGASVQDVELRVRFDAPWPTGLTVGSDNVRLNCVPVVNVFETTADPVRPTLERPRQALRPAGLAPGHGEVYAVRRVLARTSDHPGVRRLATFSEFEATAHDPAMVGAFYVAEPTHAARGRDTQLSIGTADGTTPPLLEFLSIEMLATNGDLAGSLGIGDVCHRSAGAPTDLRARNISAVTPYRPPPTGSELRWRALAASALSAVALAQPSSLRTLLHVLNLHPLADPQAARAHEQRMLAIDTVICRRAAPLVTSEARADAPFGSSFGGYDVEVVLHDAGFDDEGDAMMFGSVLATLFAHQASLNSFVRTTVRLSGSGRIFRFPARHADRVFEDL